MEKEILYRFFEGKASYKEEEEVYNWAEASKENMQKYLKERKYFDMLLVQDRKNRLYTSSRNVFRMNNIIKYVAAIAIIVMCSLQIYHLTKQEIDVEMNTISVPAGQRVNVLLSDGTNVWLNSGSKMKYPASFSQNKRKREVILDGEGYFEVAKEVKRPFVVQTSKYEIEVLGTIFNVDAYNKTSSFSAALMEGLIQISDKTESTPKIVLRPLQKVNFIDGQLVIEKIQNSDIYRWKEGLLCFEHIAFNDLMKEFNKTYDIEIVNENKNLDNYICSGKFRISDGLDFILQVLQRDVNFSFSRNENNTIIYIK